MTDTDNIWVIKKDNTLEKYDEQKIINACEKAASRAMYQLTEQDKTVICNAVRQEIEKKYSHTLPTIKVTVSFIHSVVEQILLRYYPEIGQCYQQYRNYKLDFVKMMDGVYTKSQGIRYIGDVSNANTDSAMISTQRSLIYGQLNKELYQKFFLNQEERQAANDGYIYIHDMKDRLDGINCCLFDMKNVLTGGFEMGNLWYNEPKTLDVAFDVISDIVMSAASQQYGGFTIPEIDKLLAPYAEKSYKNYLEEYENIIIDSGEVPIASKADGYAIKKVAREFEQGFQSWEMAWNSVGSSRGDYPFLSVSFGIGLGRFEQMATEIILKTRMNGQGKNGFKKPVLFPKLTFLYDNNLHGEDKELEYLFDIAIDCSSKAMYPDFLSLTGEGYISSMYKQYGKVVSLMGCVDGNSVIDYKIDETRYVTSFEVAWDKLSNIFEVKTQPNGIDSYIELKGVTIYDNKKDEYVNVQRMIRNTQSDWLDINFSDERYIKVTTDHPFEVEGKGVVLAKDLTIGDKILKFTPNKINTNTKVLDEGMILKDEVSSLITMLTNIEAGRNPGIKRLPKGYHSLSSSDNASDYVTVSEIIPYTKSAYSYDVTTDSEHFTVNGIYSHNCRASLSPWFSEGGMKSADENDTPIFVGRFNLGAISLHLPMILAKARQENKDFYEVLDYYLNMIRNLHKRTYDFIGEKKASTNPLGFMQGGFLGGNLKADEKIKPLLKPMTMSFGITALNELQRLYNGKSIVEDGTFALEVMRYINDKVNQFKEEDGILYAIYGTPAESLAGLQITQFKQKYGVVENVSDKPYVSNSFHCHVTENITPIEKQDLEKRFWDLFNGGKIQYCRYPISYNKTAIKTLVRRAMEFGFYEGINMSLAYCENCGHEELEMDVCPKCGSMDITKIDRMNGYLGYTRIHGKSRYNEAKVAEIKDRVSM